MKCFLSQLAAQKLKYYVDSVNAEISWIGKSEIIDGNIYIKDVLIRKQVCTGSNTNIDEDDDAMEAFKMVQAGENLNDWNVWWHSHANMGVFWSGTDTNTIKSHANNGGYLVSLVTNKKGEYRTRLDIFPKDVSPLKITTYYLAKDEIPTEILPEVSNPERKAELEKILDEKFNETNQQIKDIKEFYKIKLEEFTKTCSEEEETLVADVTNAYDEENADMIAEYMTLSESVIAENDELKAQIEAEVAEKVSVNIPISRPIVGSATYPNGWWKNKTSSDNYIDGLFGKRKKESNQDDEFDNRLNKIKRDIDQYNQDNPDDYFDGYEMPQSARPGKKKSRKERRRERAAIRKNNKLKKKNGQTWKI